MRSGRKTLRLAFADQHTQVSGGGVVARVVRMISAAEPARAFFGDQILRKTEMLGQLRELRRLELIRILLHRNIRLFGIVLQRAEDWNLRKRYAHALEFRAQIAHIARDVMTDYEFAILEIVVDFIGAAGKNIAAGELFQLVYAQSVHLARIAVDRPRFKIHILAANAPPVDDQIGKLNDPAGVHSVELNVQCDHPIGFFE